MTIYMNYIMQAILLTSRGSPWSVCWFDVESLPLVIPRTGSGVNVAGLLGAATALPTPPALSVPASIEEGAKKDGGVEEDACGLEIA
jgi:hypothetical protein